MGGALKGKGWKATRENKTWKSFTAWWDLGNKAFPMGFSTCAVFFGVDTPSLRLTKTPGTPSIKPTDFLADLEGKISWVEPTKTYPKKRSCYMQSDIKNRKMKSASTKTMARNGATLFPYNLIRIKTQKKINGGIEFETMVTTGRWKKYGTQKGIVPARWIKNCIYTQNLYPYITKTSTSCIIPLSGNKWDATRDTIEYWARVSDIYAGNLAKGINTPKTLEERLNYNKEITSQLKQSGWSVVYNAGGDTLYAMKIKHKKYIVEHGLFYVTCKSEAEADFLSAILNASIMLPAINGAKTSATYFGAKIWESVPIPCFDKTNKLHQELVKASRQACKVAEKTYKANLADFKKNKWGNWKMGKLIRQALVSEGGGGGLMRKSMICAGRYFQSTQIKDQMRRDADQAQLCKPPMLP